MKPHTWALPPLDLPALEAFIQGRPLHTDHRHINPGDLYLACRREHSDGRDDIAYALHRGAAAVLWEEEGFTWNPRWQVPHMPIPQLRYQAGIIAAQVLDNPSQQMRMLGVTGTNGKTSVTTWLGQALESLGHKAGLLTTVGNGFYGRLEPSPQTTMGPLPLQRALAAFRAGGASHVAMEVSSHALAQGRCHGVYFDLAIFTNLTRDHLDYHGSMAAYGGDKARLFVWQDLKTAVINADDDFGKQLLASTQATRKISYGIHAGDVRAVEVQTSLDGLRLTVETPQGRATLRSGLIGRFNVYNLLATLAALLALDVPLADALPALEKLCPAPGRMQCLGGQGQPLVVVDYAHSPDALEKALLALRDILPQGSRLHCLFGCGGDRDPGKRPLMGDIASRLADVVLLTSDNPRSENPLAILADIAAGIHDKPHDTDPDRARAIATAISRAAPGDVVLLAGKGHEDYQEIEGIKQHFDDVEQAAAALAQYKS